MRLVVAAGCFVFSCLCLGATLCILAIALSGCGAIKGDGKGRVSVGACDIIVGDELGNPPPRHGGPESEAEEGTGIECVVWRF